MDDLLRGQAVAIAELMPRLIRRLSDSDGPTMDMPIAQVRVCGILQDGPRTMSCLSKELGISLSAVTQIANRLQKSRMVERVAEADDRRVKLLQLTRRGREVMRARKERRVERILEALTLLPSDDRSRVVSSFEDLLDAAAPRE